MAYKDYNDLDIWQDGIRFVTAIYQATKQFPSDERFGLTSQIQRAAVSIPSNIAEGYAQRSDPILGRHLRIAIGSAAEVDTQLLIAQQLKYISTDQMTDLREQVQSLRLCDCGLRAKSQEPVRSPQSAVHGPQSLKTERRRPVGPGLAPPN